jgi:ribonuclease-3
MGGDFNKLYDVLGYSFANEELLILALRHRSAGGHSNERLEFLGDSILGMVIAHEVYRRYPGMREGEMSRMRSSLVNGETLASVSLNLTLNQHLILGSGEEKSGGRERYSILADVLEAIIAAIYLDAGLDQVRTCILTWFNDLLLKTNTEAVAKDAKSLLQEWMQGHKLPLPTYDLVSVTGEAHAQEFTVTCFVEGLSHSTEGVSTSRRRAEQIAAAAYLEIIYEQ